MLPGDAHFKNADRFHRTCSAVYVENVNAATIAWRQVHLSRE
jgi:hypothetical protein